ncbi:MAG: tryptophanase [Deltaproteobacteria bacterium]|nr:tryptophanase [Deltaproteobacteria bacterium]
MRDRARAARALDLRVAGLVPERQTIIEPFKIKVVEPLPQLTRAERARELEAAGWNLFLVPARRVTFDFLTDSGTTAMSAAQWAAMMIADESYAGSRSFEALEATVRRVTGFRYIIPTHQGRAAEHLLFSMLVRPGSIVPSNNHFDTTRANIEQLGGEAVDLVCAEARDARSAAPFKGNLDVERLDELCRRERDRIPLGMITITNNAGGGQPVSLANLRAVAEVYRRYDIPFIIDACRFAENAWFIKRREPENAKRAVRAIAREVFDLADGCMMSGKKDGMVNIGGFIALRSDAWVPRLRSGLILTEGFPTYGGMAARDMEAFAVGIDEALEEPYLAYREAVAAYVASGLERIGMPVMQPPGAHAVYLDAGALLPDVPPASYPGQALVASLYLIAGVRGCEVGSVMFGKHLAGTFVPAARELVRLAFPRRVYTQAHMDYVIEATAEVVAGRGDLRGMRIVEEPPFLRHFTAKFAPL